MTTLVWNFHDCPTCGNSRFVELGLMPNGQVGQRAAAYDMHNLAVVACPDCPRRERVV